jgi:SAM-dependent methyltransferase
MDVQEQTINDYGDQFTLFGLEGYAEGRHGTTQSLHDYLGPLLNLDDIEKKRIVDIGSGAGRVVIILLGAGAGHVHAVEPSHVFDEMVKNTKAIDANRVSHFHGRGDQYVENGFDTAISLGVLHHIPSPDPVVHHIYQSLKPGGTVYAWLYGKENNRFILAILEPIHALTKRLPDRFVHFASYIGAIFLTVYGWLCKFLPLQLRRYMLEVFMKNSFRHRILVLFDLLNPAYAKYYTKEEVQQLFSNNGFTKIELFHRAESSWGVKAVK